MQNSRKARDGLLAALLDPEFIARKRGAEEKIRAAVAGRQASGGQPGPFERIEKAEEDLARVAVRHALLEGGIGFNSAFFRNARTILRAATEASKPTGERLREYRDSNRESLELGLFSPEPVYEDFEIAKLADSLSALATTLGADDPLVVKVLAGLSPRERAARLVRGTRLGRRAPVPGRPDVPDERRSLYDGGLAAVDRSADPMIELARSVDAEARSLRGVVEAAGEVKKQAHAEIAAAVFAARGADVYPDATFTLRLAYGTVRGLEEQGEKLPALTDFAGLFARSTAKQGKPPFDLPPRWESLRGKLTEDKAFLGTPFNFACTADIIGGNSGSPVVNAAGELVGVIFDGNIHSLRLDLAYDDVKSRAVAVDARAIVAALEKVYGQRRLVAELLGEVPGDAAWQPLFDGKALGKWRPTEFGGNGEVAVKDGAISIGMGADMSGITDSGDVPRQDYEISLEAQRADGNDFFCGLTFPVGKDPCSLIVGGWGGGVVGLSSIDGRDAAHNDTTSFREFKTGRWYAVRVRVTPERIVCFIDDEQVVDQPLEGRRISVRDEVIPSQPLGIATYATTALVRNIRWRELPPAAPAPAAPPR